jgi:hypothetical protein
VAVAFSALAERPEDLILVITSLIHEFYGSLAFEIRSKRSAANYAWDDLSVQE